MAGKILFLALTLTVLYTVTEGKYLQRKFDDITSSESFKSSLKPLKSLVRSRRSVSEVADSSEEAVELLKFFLTLGWAEKKHDLLTGFLDAVADSDSNITVVGWQKVHNPDGSVKSVNAIELAVPPKPISEEKKDKNVEVSEEEEELSVEDWEDGVPHEALKTLRQVTGALESLGIPVSITFEEYNKEGELTGKIFLDDDDLFATAENFTIYNKTLVASKEEVQNFIANLKPTSLGKPTILKYDVNGNVLAEQSDIKTPLLGSVVDFYEITDDILLKSPKIIAEISQLQPHSEIPKQLALAFAKEWPEYRWRVLVDPGNDYINKDISITLSYDNLSFDENSNITYLVYGVKISNTTTK